VNGWLLPAGATAFWAGIAAADKTTSWLGPWPFLLSGIVLVLTAAVLAPPSVGDPEPLAVAGLIRSAAPAAVVALPTVRLGTARAPPGAPLLVAIVALGLLGSGWASLRTQNVRGSGLASLTGSELRVTGSLGSDPAEGLYGWTAILAVSVVELPSGDRVWPGGALLLEGDGPLPTGARWDRVAVIGRVAGGGLGSEGFLARRGADALFRLSSYERLGPSRNPLLRLAQVVRSSLSDGIRTLFPPRESGLLLGLAVGDTSQLDAGLEEDFRATGLGHLLAVSGQNVAMVLAPVIGMAILLRSSARARFMVGSGTVLVFVLVTGLEPSVLRAGLMAVVAMAGVLWGRPRSPGSVLGAAVLILLVADPRLAGAVGFQLSVAATAGLLLLASPLAARLGRLPRPVAVAMATTLAAQAGVTPLLLYHFQVVPLGTLPANLLALPAVAPALLLGVAAAGARLLFRPVGAVLAGIALLPLRYLEAVADRFASAPVPSITSLGGGTATLMAGIAAVLVTAWWFRSGRRISPTVAAAAALLLPLFVWATALGSGPPSGLVVRFIDVGQGDAALVTAPDGATLLVDAGPDEDFVATKLASLGVKRIDLVVATHAHADHVAGLPPVLARFPVSLVVEPGCPRPSAAYSDFLTALLEEDVPVRHPRAGEVLIVGELRLDVLSPSACAAGTESDPNNDSLVFLLTYGEDTVLFTGDVEEPGQESLLEDGVPLAADVLKVPHHGGATSLIEFFVEVDPKVAVVSVGPNEYGHPVPAILEALAATGADVLRTDLAGDVVVRFDPRGLLVESRAA
jgi:competence protein ComEC